MRCFRWPPTKRTVSRKKNSWKKCNFFSDNKNKGSVYIIFKNVPACTGWKRRVWLLSGVVKQWQRRARAHTQQQQFVKFTSVETVIKDVRNNNNKMFICLFPRACVRCHGRQWKLHKLVVPSYSLKGRWSVFMFCNRISKLNLFTLIAAFAGTNFSGVNLLTWTE